MPRPKLEASQNDKTEPKNTSVAQAKPIPPITVNLSSIMLDILE
jgi:hypothetical protein